MYDNYYGYASAGPASFAMLLKDACCKLSVSTHRLAFDMLNALKLRTRCLQHLAYSTCTISEQTPLAAFQRAPPQRPQPADAAVSWVRSDRPGRIAGTVEAVEVVKPQL
jgi:hypothetical protein